MSGPLGFLAVFLLIFFSYAFFLGEGLGLLAAIFLIIVGPIFAFGLANTKIPGWATILILILLYLATPFLCLYVFSLAI